MSIEWKGPQDGLPPVGTECEALIGEWVDAKVIGYNGVVCVMATRDGGYFGMNNPEFVRPVRLERKKAIDEMLETIDDMDFSGSMAEDLYDAGYRKPMSRAEAEIILWDFLGLTVPQSQKDQILNALGYKE